MPSRNRIMRSTRKARRVPLVWPYVVRDDAATIACAAGAPATTPAGVDSAVEGAIQVPAGRLQNFSGLFETFDPIDDVAHVPQGHVEIRKVVGGMRALVSSSKEAMERAHRRIAVDAGHLASLYNGEIAVFA